MGQPLRGGGVRRIDPGGACAGEVDAGVPVEPERGQAFGFGGDRVEVLVAVWVHELEALASPLRR